MLLMPYGSSHHADMVAKVGSPKATSERISNFAPYGSAENADIAAKVGDSKVSGDTETRKVVRLNARRR